MQKKLKRIFVILFVLAVTAFVVVVLVARYNYNKPKEETIIDRNYGTSVTDAYSTSVQPYGEDIVFSADNFNLVLVKNTDGYSIEVNKDNTFIVKNDNPVSLTVCKRPGFNSVEETELKCKYNNLYASQNNNVLAVATITTQSGSIFDVVDEFTFTGKSIDVNRKINVIKAVKIDNGFRSEFSLFTDLEPDSENQGDFSKCDYFIPSILYKDENNVVAAAIASSLSSRDKILVKETRTGLPMVMMINKANGATISLVHRNPCVSSPDETESKFFAVSDDFKVGAVGIIRDPSPAVSFVYPCVETQDYGLTGGGSGTKRYAEIEDNNSVSFSVGIFSSIYNSYDYSTGKDFNNAMVECYEENINNQNLKSITVDLRDIYKTTISDLKDLYITGANNGAGFPFDTFVTTGANDNISFSMGFVGMQTSLGFQLIRSAFDENCNCVDVDAFIKGQNILNFWAYNAPIDITVKGNTVSMLDIEFSANATSYYRPLYLRTMTDGAEGLLEAARLCEYLYSATGNITYKNMKDLYGGVAINYANFLVNIQNSDYSFYRAYTRQGLPCTEENAAAAGQAVETKNGENLTVGDSKINTPIAIRFLIRMYEWTGNSAYKTSAENAAEYCINEISSAGKYVGGTTDNANTCDREAGVYALYAFNAMYTVTGDIKYLEYAKHAAIFSMSWTYTFSFKVNNKNEYAAGKSFEEGLNEGLSFIATGHSSVDSFMSYAYYEFFKLWVWTGENFYYKAASFLQNVTKQTLSCVSNLGFAYGSFCVEATNIANFTFKTAEDTGVWLPWISEANIEPMINMLQTFGNADVVSVRNSYSREELIGMLNSYGSGGKNYGQIYNFEYKDTEVSIDGVNNARWVIKDKVYRSALLENITEDGIETAVNVLGIKTDLDLRGLSEGDYVPTMSPLGENVYLINTPILWYVDAINNINGSESVALKEAIEVFADINNYPILFHCVAGRDRTGTLGMLIEGVLGWTEEDIRHDYELSLDNYSEDEKAYFMGFFNETYNLIMTKYANSGNFSDACENFMLKIGVSNDNIALIRRLLKN